jgi:hypothetical protein
MIERFERILVYREFAYESVGLRHRHRVREIPAVQETLDTVDSLDRFGDDGCSVHESSR